MRFPALALVALTSLGGGSAWAEGRNPGSLLVFPAYDTTPGHTTLVSVSNTNPDPLAGGARVEIVFVRAPLVGAPGCLETNATVVLSPNDTLTFLASALNPNSETGFAYAFAKNQAGVAIAFDWLAGDLVVLDGLSALDYAVTPYAFRSPRPPLAPTDVDLDGIRDLDGVEYEMAPARICVPRFVGQSATYQSQLVLVGLTGGAQFTTTVDFLVYNDNEEVFSQSYSFRCVARVALGAISPLFTQNFLANFTAHAPGETVGATGVETGWFELDGRIASSTAKAIADPAILAFLIERTGPLGGAELPFELGRQANGDLLPLGLGGDPTP